MYALLSFAIPLVIYVITLYPSVPGGDSGELITAAYTLSVAHPPGYPLYLLFAKLFSFLPWSSVAWRINLFSGFCDAGASLFLFLAVATWTRNKKAGIISACLFALAPLTWRYAVSAEVFALNNLFTAALLYLAVKLAAGKERKFLFISTFVFGLGLSNHHILLLTGGPILIWMISHEKEELFHAKSVRSILQLTGLFALGLLPYLVIPVLGTRSGPISWGDVSSLGGFLTHILRSEYGTLKLGAHTSSQFWDFIPRLFLYFKDLFAQTLVIGIPLMCIGIIRFSKKFVLIAFLSHLIIFHALANTPINNPLSVGIMARFWQPLNILAFFWIGIGISSLTGKKWGTYWSYAALLLIPLQVAINFNRQDQHDNYIIRDFAKTLLSDLPEKAILITTNDLNTLPALYLQNCEGYRKDIAILPQELLVYPWKIESLRKLYSDITMPGTRYRPGKDSGLIEIGFNSAETLKGSFSMVDFLKANLNQRRIFIHDGFRREDAGSVSASFMTIAWGLSFEVIPLNTGRAPKPLILVDTKLMAKYGDDTWEHQVLLNYKRTDNSPHPGTSP